MAEDSQNIRRDKPEQKDKFIPPPMDPYATYQTPYERRQSPEPNPFIEFRRFADKQISDIFAGLQTFANFPKMFGVENGMKDLREQLEKDIKEMVALQKAQDEELREFTRNMRSNTYKPIPPSATTATSPASSDEKHDFAQAVSSDSRQEPGADSLQKWITATGADGKEWSIDPSSGLAVPKVSDASTSGKSEQLEDPKVRWKRGFRNCPELKKYRGETELDMYETFEDLSKPRGSTTSSSKEKPSWSSWLPAYGYDGLQKSKKNAETAAAIPSQQEEILTRPCDTKTYRLGQTFRMDPLKNDHEFLPWIILSPYSPLSLANPEWVNLKSTKLHNGCEGGCSSPMHIYSHRIRDNHITEQDCDFRARLAGQAPWADAFEDLLSLERTGKMPDREVDGRIHPKNMTSSWIRDMIEKGLLGPKWWLQDGEIMRDSRDDPTARSRRRIDDPGDRLLELLLQHNSGGTGQTEPFDNTQLEELKTATRQVKDNVMKGDFSDAAKAQVQLHQQALENLRLPQQQSVPNDLSSTEPIPRTKDTKTPQPPPTDLMVTPTPAQPEQPPTPIAKPKMSVISTLTTMTSRTLPDGSVETKRILKKRFADGNEESEESTEVVYPKLPELTSTTEASKEQQKKQGWFWT